MSFLLSKQSLGLLLLVGLSLMSCQNQPKSSMGEVTAVEVQESQKETPNTTIGLLIPLKSSLVKMRW